MAGLPEGPSWEQIQRLIANLNTERPSHIRDRAIILLLAVYGLRIRFADYTPRTYIDTTTTSPESAPPRVPAKRKGDFAAVLAVSISVKSALNLSQRPLRPVIQQSVVGG